MAFYSDSIYLPNIAELTIEYDNSALYEERNDAPPSYLNDSAEAHSSGNQSDDEEMYDQEDEPVNLHESSI